jgi:WD40 repeat protein
MFTIGWPEVYAADAADGPALAVVRAGGRGDVLLVRARAAARLRPRRGGALQSVHTFRLDARDAAELGGAVAAAAGRALVGLAGGGGFLDVDAAAHTAAAARPVLGGPAQPAAAALADAAAAAAWLVYGEYIARYDWPRAGAGGLGSRREWVAPATLPGWRSDSALGVPIAAAAWRRGALALLYTTGLVALFACPSLRSVAAMSLRAEFDLAALPGARRPSASAPAIALHPLRPLVAVALAGSADVVLLRWDSAARSAALLARLSLSHWGVDPASTGDVSCIQWSPGGDALAIGWERRGLAVWSADGACRLMCTISLIDSAAPHNASDAAAAPSEHVELLHEGTRSLAWGCGGSYLYAVPNGSENLLQFRTVRSASVLHASLNFSKHAVLLGSDRLLLLEKHSVHLDLPQWEHVLLPPEYLAANWPIHLIAVNRRDTLLAIAGARGAAVLRLDARRWTLFGNVNDEMAIAATAMCWYRNALVLAHPRDPAAAANGDDELVTPLSRIARTSRLTVFNGAHLARSSALASMDLPSGSVVTHMDSNENEIAVFCTDGSLLIYSVELLPAQNRVVLSFVKLVTLSAAPRSLLLLSAEHVRLCAGEEDSVSPAPVLHSSDLLALSETHGTDAETSAEDPPGNVPVGGDLQIPLSSQKTYCIVLNSRDQLLLACADDGTLQLLAEEVDQFWIGVPGSAVLSADAGSGAAGRSGGPGGGRSDAVMDIGNTLWSYGKSGMQLWYPFFSSTAPRAMPVVRRSSSAEFDLDIYPLGLALELGVLIALTHSHVSSERAGGLPLSFLSSKIHPFLHAIFAHMLRTGGSFRQVVRLARSLQPIPHFVHSLELLLHETLNYYEDNSEAVAVPGALPRESGQMTLLRSVVALLEEFPDLLCDVVVRCARKSDMVVWPMLFSVAGSPEQFFERAFRDHNLGAAASYLRIILAMSGEAQARICSMRLLERATDRAFIELDLMRDLMRFISQLDEIRGQLPNAAEVAILDGILSRYAVTHLIASGKFLDLLHFGAAVARPIRPWLVAAYYSRQANPSNLAAALWSLHAQFYIPFSSEMSPHVSPRSSIDRSDPTSASIDPQELSMHLSMMKQSADASRLDLEYLLDELVVSRNLAWGLLVATVLFDETRIVELLDAHEAAALAPRTLREDYLMMLAASGTPQYRSLSRRLRPAS